MTDVSQSPQSSLCTSELDYELPPGLVAIRPAEPRDSARLLLVHRSNDRIEHRRVGDLPEILAPGDLLVFNTTAVLPARLVGQRADTAGHIEGLFLGELDDRCWRAMLRSNGRLRVGQRIDLVDADGRVSDHQIELIAREGETWIVRPTGDAAALAILQQVGRTPLPPYIRRARGPRDFDDATDRLWYETVYARVDQRESVAAPTAGLHFTPELLTRLAEAGVGRADVTLHVGPGTFKPITAASLDEHEMHSERFTVPPETLERLGSAHASRVIAVGTTVVRTLESLPSPIRPTLGEPVVARTDLLIAPPHEFKHVDGMLTNFHLPRSTLLALVGAMLGLDRTKSIYREAIAHDYRFYSYGDAMLILP